MSSRESSGLRADAVRNRQRVLAAARATFAEDGLDASTNEIARRAGVGIATLLRRFPTREGLVAAVFAEKVASYHAAAEAALQEADPWVGLCSYIERVCEMQAEDYGFADLFTTQAFPSPPELRDARDRAADALATIMERAQATGALRPDFEHQDLPLFLMANAGVVAATRHVAPDAWRRVAAYLIQSLASPAAQPLPPAPSRAQVYAAMTRVEPKPH
ncbi:helix-turn-helix domain-containing protein [Rhodococcoides fascians]|uniref:TetR/AcrR family transcriptional regulator n=1 Tax=Rhodococcoides fascians TaxID=1828 RepID=UPI002ACDB981|nr:helix-turn-helix domain-containing protein [Rhodococcus fascians]WQH28824.1 helix-turn-helix domain-containing protein [Rhodococcus fascians]